MSEIIEMRKLNPEAREIINKARDVIPKAGDEYWDNPAFFELYKDWLSATDSKYSEGGMKQFYTNCKWWGRTIKKWL